MFSAGYLADVDLDHGTTLNKKIRNAQLAQYNFIFGRFYFFVSQMLLLRQPRVTMDRKTRLVTGHSPKIGA